MGRYSHPPVTDIQGRPRVSVGQRELCNNVNSEQGCTRQNYKFLHSCLVCKGPHSSVRCPHNSIVRPGRMSQPRMANRQPTAQWQTRTHHIGERKVTATPIDIDRLEMELTERPDRYFAFKLVNGLRDGFFTGIDVPPTVSFECPNNNWPNVSQT